MSMSNEEYAAWLASLKPGDDVAVVGWGTALGVEIFKVDKVTPTGRVRVGNQLFTRGRCNVNTGGGWRIEPATQEVRDSLERSRLASKLQHKVNWCAYPLSALRAVNAIIEQARSEKLKVKAKEPTT